MTEILHDLIYQNPRNYGSIVYITLGLAGFLSSAVASESSARFRLDVLEFKF